MVTSKKIPPRSTSQLNRAGSTSRKPQFNPSEKPADRRKTASNPSQTFFHAPKTKDDDAVTAWAKDVRDGKAIAGPHVRNACRRHLLDRDEGHKRGLHWDQDAAKWAIEFFEVALRLAGGQFEGLPFKLHPSQQFIVGSIFGWKRADGTRRFRRAYVEQAKGSGKALALDTPIPTPSGWTTMGALRIGDYVFDENGISTRILAVSPIMEGHDCYAVTFDDGAEIVADADHLWLTEMRRSDNPPESARRATRGVPKADWGKWRHGAHSTREIAETLRYSNGKYRSANHSVALAKPLDLPEAILPVDPFVLGIWLGNGDSDCARITIADNDDETIENLRAVGCVVGPRRYVHQGDSAARYRIGSVGVRGIGGGASLNAALRREGLLHNKHIPDAYLRASFRQRLALLQGLMDTDGYISKANGECEFTTVTEKLAEGFRELAHSLGLKIGYRQGIATLNGRAIGPKWRIQFFPPVDLPVFQLSRKKAQQIKRHDRRRLSADRRIVDCKPVSTVPVRCITVAASSQLYLAGRAMVPTHNSPLAAGIGHYCLMADKEPRAEVYAAAANTAQAHVLFRDAVAMREQSPGLRKRLTPSGGNPVWNLADMETGSFFRPISSEVRRSGSGPRPSCALCDEVHEHPDGLTIEMLERGFKWRRQPLLLMTTNSGTDRNSVCWQEHQFAVQVAAGTRTPDDDATFVGEVIEGGDAEFSFVAGLDRDDDPLNDPTCWEKSNPLIGVTMTHEKLAEAVAQAKAIPGKLNGILRLNFCVWTDSETAWMSRAMLEEVLADFDPAEHFGEPLYVGLDLSATRDMTAAAFLVPTGMVEVERENETVLQPTFDLWVEAWTPGDTLAERALQDHARYDVWAEQGFLNVTPGRVVRMDIVAARLAEAQTEYSLEAIAFDAYAFRKNFAPELDQLGVTAPLVEHPQGGKRKASETELWMPGSLKELETLILERRIRIRSNDLTISAFMSAATESDAFDNRWFSKRHATNRIDGLVASAMAVGAAMWGRGFETLDVAAFIG